MSGGSKASDPAKEFGAQSLFICFGISGLSGQEIGDVSFGPDQRAYRFGPAFGVGRLAAGERFVRFVQQAPQPCPAIHVRLTSC
jgi:hypothetical protein